MNDIKNLLRQRDDLDLTRDRIAAATGASAGTVSHVPEHAAAAGLSWPLPGDLDDEALRERLHPSRERDSGHAPGLGGLSGFSGKTLGLRTGCGEKDVELFVAVLAHSCMTHAEAVPDQRVRHWAMAHRRALERFGGVPERWIIDNLKAGVDRQPGSIDGDRDRRDVRRRLSGTEREERTLAVPVLSGASRADAEAGPASRVGIRRIPTPRGPPPSRRSDDARTPPDPEPSRPR